MLVIRLKNLLSSRSVFETLTFKFYMVMKHVSYFEEKTYIASF